MADPLFTMGARRTAETLTEMLVPFTVAGTVWWQAKNYLAEPSVSRELSTFELYVLLCGVAAIGAWYAGRQLCLVNVKRPWTHVFVIAGTCLGSMYGLGTAVRWGFSSECTELAGLLVQTQVLFGSEGLVCQIGGVPDNPYLAGVLLRPAWDGHISFPLGVVLAIVPTLVGYGMRDVRLRSSRIGLGLIDQLQLAPAAGDQAVLGDASDVVQACANATLWGEPCGQMYPKSKVFEPGEWCVRCAQVYQRTERVVSFDVVSLFTSDIDVLNGLERLDASAWGQGEPEPPDARLSGQERWVRLGRIEVPDVVSVATLMQFLHGRLKVWAGSAREEDQLAFDLAAKRASKLACWIWMGRHRDRLTYARPTHRALLALGATRLRDLDLDIGEELVLQLDIGLMPLELRSGFRQTFLDGREPIVQNSKQDFWVPVTAIRPRPDGLWIPRIEGAALRAWLSLDRIRPPDVRGVTSPRAYVGMEGEPDAATGTLDLVRMPLDGTEPTMEIWPGTSIAEWVWMERQQIELLRQQVLVMVDA